MSDPGTVMTVLGPIPADQLGYVLPHEHPFCQLRQAPYRYDFPDQFDDDRVVTAEVAAFGELGGTTLVDLTVPDIGRSPERLRKLSQNTGVQVVMGCGWYRGNYYRAEDVIEKRTAGSLADQLIAEITEGVDGTGIKPGVIGEIGVEKTWVAPAEERVLRAAARAHKETGLALGAIHAIGPVAPDILTIFEEEDVDMSRVAVGHCDSYPHMEFLEGLIARGALIMFDNCGQYGALKTFEEHIMNTVKELVDKGLEDYILLSHDTCKFPQFKIHGGPGFVYISETVIPTLRNLGITEETINKIIRDNPRRWLVGS
ncbi:MAG: hypothetical protein F4X18_02700 [Acidimicrobiia bacterium]|nr:hypothetical protein [Acidimicrobiia bacterium]